MNSTTPLYQRIEQKKPTTDTIIEVYTLKGRTSLWRCRSIELAKREQVASVLEECKKLTHAQSIEILSAPESRLVTLDKVNGTWIEEEGNN